MRSIKRGQMKMSFGMIFSIILIVIFIAVAFYAISKFLNYQKRIQVGQFVNYIQEDIDKMWKGSHGATERTYTLPNKIEYVCFTDFSKSGSGPNAGFYSNFQFFSSGEESNMFFYPVEASQGLESIRIDNIDIGKITEQENPYCIANEKGVKIRIIIDLGDTLVTLNRI
jgi:hypothetical protein